MCILGVRSESSFTHWDSSHFPVHKDNFFYLDGVLYTSLCSLKFSHYHHHCYISTSSTTIDKALAVASVLTAKFSYTCLGLEDK